MDISALDITKAKVAQFNKRNIWTVEDLVEFMPKSYNDFRFPKTCNEIIDSTLISIVGRVQAVSETTTKAGRPMVTFKMIDKNESIFYVRYLNAQFMSRLLAYGDEVVFCGNPQIEMKGSNKIITFFNPLRYSKNISSLTKIVPVYKKITGMSTDYFEKALNEALELVKRDDYLELSLRDKYHLISTSDKVDKIHHPETFGDIKDAKKRVLFDDLFIFNFLLKERSNISNNVKLPVMAKAALLRKYIEDMPFELTEDQKKSIKEMFALSKEGKRINALLQGDVGYGKTEVAKALSLIATNSGYKTILMAPTIVLARQHYNDFKNSFKSIPVTIAYLSSELKKSEINKIKKQIANNEIDILIGTQSVLSDEIEVNNLGLLIIDEEHKFGVKQRDKINKKSKNGVHILSMSATPIPRSMALAMYSDDIQILDIKTAPAFKKDIITSVVHTDAESIQVIDKELQKGHQAYIVCPLIEDSESETMGHVKSVEAVYEEYKEYYGRQGVKVGMINGRMKDEEVEETINKFLNKEMQILISTTIIEVGVNVPNATVIVIKNAERFGLSQLHQLRGRVGRGEAQGYCVLETPIEDEVERLNVLVSTNDGFKIAEEDLKLRGAGDFIGTTQTGDNKYISLIMKYPTFNQTVRDCVNKIYSDENRRNYYREKLQKTIEQNEN